MFIHKSGGVFPVDKTDEKILRYTLRINRTAFQKFRYVAGYDGRSANKELEQYIKKRVDKFEAMHGTIDTNEPSS